MKNIKSLLTILSFIFVFSFAISAQNLTALEGGKVDLENQKGKVVVLAIGASWLPLSKDQAVFTNKIAKKFAGRDVVVYFVATDSSSTKSKNYASDDDLSSFAARNKLTVPVLRDSDGSQTLKKYGVDQIPSFVILGKDGKPATEAFGGIDPKSDISVPISQAIEKLL
ncbi:MAG: TlpA family protein disulfide reductase [Acidobacteriota bacterium]|nr:TlpA family protein disulfide reductase [Acidobacteriota bacterium]